MRLRLRRDWQQGQHATIIAPVGSGKTYLALNGLLPLWQWVLVLDGKGEDRLLRQVKPKVRGYPEKPYPEKGATFRIAPSYEKGRSIFTEVMERAWRDSNEEGGWVVYTDELRLFCDTRNQQLNRGGALGEKFARAWLQGRSRNMTLISSTQQPKHVPDTAFDQPRYLFVFQFSDKEQIRRLAEMMGVDRAELEGIVPYLGRHEFVMFDRHRRDDLVISKVTG